MRESKKKERVRENRIQQAPTALRLLHQEKNQSWRLSATPEEISQEIVASDTSSSEAIVSGGGGQDGVALIIQVLLIVAFLALSVLTIGVVYIGVTEFLGKRREKFEKEEAAKKSKKSGKKKATRAKAGPRGFGQKIEDDDIDIDLE
ncbi:hypothetical protein Bca52824_003133 [Brassica carinata]|uniref:Uncharacterized protein n=1 Tax=Brassica carinata TaxID=52824 RepID=A0A8X7WJ78_BRACI|nr:hypothetical protein Bca52824_003133 [Brassica carinata]